MNRKEIPDNVIDTIAQHINERVSRPARISVAESGHPESPHYFETVPFGEIDDSDRKYFAIDGSYNSQEFHNGIYIGVYTAGYVCYHKGAQIRLNDMDDTVILGNSYIPNNILITNERHRDAVFEELLEMSPVKEMLKFFNAPKTDAVWGFGEHTRESVCASVSKLLAFCQEILEWALVLEILRSPECRKGDIILRDGVLRTPQILQKYLARIGEEASRCGVRLLAVTKHSPIKMELSSSFKKIDEYLEQKKPSYPFKTDNARWQKLCCWFEVGDDVLVDAYPETGHKQKAQKEEDLSPTKYSMFATRNLRGGRGFGLFFAARLDYVEKLQNYDWVIVDVNVFDAVPGIRRDMTEEDIRKAARNNELLSDLFRDLTRLTQEHYILGYPYPLAEAHRFVTLKKNFNDEVVKRVKASLYQSQMMDHVDIENMFLDLHERF